VSTERAEVARCRIAEITARKHSELYGQFQYTAAPQSINTGIFFSLALYTRVSTSTQRETVNDSTAE